MTHIDRRDVQGNILRGYGLRHSAHLFASIEDPRAVRALIESLEVTTAHAQWPDKPDTTVNVAFTARGLEKMGARESEFSAAAAFREGMQPRAVHLGDDPARYAPFWSETDLWLGLHGKTRELLDERVARIERAKPQGITFLRAPLSGDAIRKGEHLFEHFGFRDGISNPAIDGNGVPAGPGTGKRAFGGGWAPIETGEFLLGYPNESGAPPDEVSPLLRNGTFVVFRQLRQDVAAFREYLARAAARYRIDEDLLAAKIVGRKHDGEPLVPPGKGVNDFGFAADPHGSGCPIGSHIRRANPRDAGGRTEMSARHRIARRGMPYGEPLPEGSPDDGRDRGLLFIAMNANIERQFEFMQQRWVNDGSSLGVGKDKDPLVGCHEGSGRMIVPGDVGCARRPIILPDLPEFVQCTGGEYFFMPGITGLKALFDREPATERA